MPGKKLVVPRLELMSCLLLLRLIMLVKKALSVEVNITKIVCWSDSKLPCGGSNLLIKNGKCGLKMGCQKFEKVLG